MSDLLYQRDVVRVATKITAIECHVCGVIFGLTDDFERQRRNDKRTFWCPNGHGAVYGTSEADTLRRKLEDAERDTNRLRAENDQAWAAATEYRKDADAKGREIKRITRRANAGECLHCKRHFVDVESHVKRKHPDESPSHLGEHKRLKK